MADAAFNASLIGKTNPHGYHQILFLSQDMINKAFHNMWLCSKPKGNENAPPLWAFKKNIRSESIDIKLKAPTVKLMTTTRGNPQLYFRMNMESGTITTYVSPDSDDMKSFNVKDWSFGFGVKIASKTLPKDDPMYTEAVTKPGFSSEVYSLAQLYLDVSASTGTQDTDNTYGAYDWASESADTKSSFNMFTSKWFNLMKENKSTVVGYALQAKKGASDHATFPPTSIDYYVYPWMDPQSSSPTKTDGSSNNALSYLMMSNFATPPETPTLDYSGTFVRTGGLFVLRSDLFWDQWLIPLLQGINKGAEVIPDKPYVTYSNNDRDYPFTVNLRFHAGVTEGHSKTTDSYYAFSKDSSRARTWNWSGRERVESNSVTDGGSQTLIVTQKSTTSTTLTFDEGGQGISLYGRTIFDFNNQFFRNGYRNGDPTHMVFTTQWHFKMALSSVSDGGVQLARVPEDKATMCNTTVSATQGTVRWKHGFEKLKTDFTNTIGNYLDRDTWEIENALLASLASHDKLFLPASGTFLMTDPKFNARGDLLVGLDYNGVDPPEAPSTLRTNYQAANIVSFKTGIRGPVAISTQGRPERIAPKPAVELAVRSVGVEIGVAA